MRRHPAPAKNSAAQVVQTFGVADPFAARCPLKRLTCRFVPHTKRWGFETVRATEKRPSAGFG
jgi:hypothetical protein